MKVLTALALGLISASLYAVDNLTFELEGDAIENASEDWETLYLGGGTADIFSGVIVDKNGSDNIFTGGGSKVPLDFPSYRWKSSPPPPDKTNITNAYAGAYDESGDQIVYFGADLFADNGDAELAFWFLQADVGLNPDGTFYGNHVNGDVYVATKFSNGGRQANIAVYKWDDTCPKDDRTPDVADSCAAGNIRIVIPEGPALCDGSGGPACAITNLVGAVAPWPYEPKSGTPQVFPATTFFEGGINITEVFGNSLCFSTFMVASGASTSFQSTAKDFALGGFDVCSINATSICYNPDEADDTPTAISYQVVGCAENDGAADVQFTSLLAAEFGQTAVTPAGLDSFLPDATFIPVDDCDDLTALSNQVGGTSVDLVGATVAAGDALIYAFPVVTAINAPKWAVELYAQGVGGATVDPSYSTAQCPPRTFNAALNATKACEVAVEDIGSTLAVLVEVDGQICNDGEVALTLQSLNDYVADGTVSLTPSGTTIPVGGCITYSGSYYPQSIPSGDLCPFQDMVTVVVTTPVNTAGADCTGDPGGPQTCTVNSNSATCVLRAGDGDNDCATGPIDPSPTP